jgi:hypothetical protein
LHTARREQILTIVAKRLTAIVLLLAAVAFGVDRLVSSSVRPPRQTGRWVAVAAAAQPPAAPHRVALLRAAPARTQSFPSELRHAPAALRQQLLRMLKLEQQVPRRTPRAVTPRLLPHSKSCSIAYGCSLKPCLYEADVETAAAVGAAGTVLLPNRPVPACVHPPPIRISAP